VTDHGADRLVVGLLADTQGRFDIDAFVQHVAGAFAGVDEIWHAGDWGSPAVLETLRALPQPLSVVNGNAPDDPTYPMIVERTIAGMRVGMVHNLDSRRMRWAQDFQVVIHGHTHRFRDEVINGRRFINPGTATHPQFGGTERTMARLAFGSTLVVQKLIVPAFPLKAGR
jgi:putative phosphoesterase